MDAIYDAAELFITPVVLVGVVRHPQKVVQNVLTDAVLTAYLSNIAGRMAFRLS